MRRALCAAALLLAGCQPMSRLEVHILEGEATGARLELCGRPPRELRRTNEGFELRIPADCRGSGRIVVSFIDGATATCPVRLVAPDLAAWYRYQVTRYACRIG